MRLLDLLERSVERVFQGPVNLVFRQEIQPAEIERELERAMLDGSRRGSGVRIMPNVYAVRLHPDDYATVQPFVTSLTRRLETWLQERADAHDGTLLDRLRITVESSEAARRRRVTIDARITDITGPASMPRRMDVPAADRTQAFRVASPRSAVQASLRRLDGGGHGAIPLPFGDATIGRSRDADIHLDAPDVSRRHLRLTWDGHELRVTDLGSTNGTRINGERIERGVARHGDEIQIGSQLLRLVVE